MKQNRRKGQMVFEFIIAAVLFFAVVIYTINYLSTTVSVYSTDFYSNTLHMKAIVISELLVKNQGVWNGGIPDVLGLASEWPTLEQQKLEDLRAYCESNYNNVLEKLDLAPKNKLRINISEDEITFWDCDSPTGMPERITIAHVKRFALSESQEPLTIDIWVW